jgi:hypothetical protein
MKQEFIFRKDNNEFQLLTKKNKLKVYNASGSNPMNRIKLETRTGINTANTNTPVTAHRHPIIFPSRLLGGYLFIL